MTTFIFFFLFFWWVMSLVYKITDLDKPNSWLLERANNVKGKKGDWLYKLLECNFCLESHIAFILALPFFIDSLEQLTYMYDWSNYLLRNWCYFVYGWMAVGLRDIIKHILNK